jgi:hypothetical protein
VPREHSTGGKAKLYGISKRGNVYLRRMFIHGARAVLLRVKYDTGGFGQWVQQMEARAPRTKVIVAIANKLARIAWAVLFREWITGPPQKWRQHRDRQGQITHQGLLGEEPNSQTACWKPCGEKWFFVTERFSRNGTRESSSWPGEKSPTRGRIHLCRLNFAHEISPCSRAADHLRFSVWFHFAHSSLLRILL